MPSKYDKIRLSETQDRRQKLTQEQREEIRKLYSSGEYSQRSLASLYGVSRSLIQILVNPERAERVSQRIKEHWKDYQVTPEERKIIQRKVRAYKRKLYLAGELKPE